MSPAAGDWGLRRFAIISDLHANLEALEAVMALVGGEEILCLGDLVDYCADPNAVVEKVKDSRARSIMGNHDSAALTGDVSRFNPRAAMSSIWTRANLSAESRAFLETLPEEMRMKVDDVQLYFVHGSPDDHLWEYVDPRTHSDLFGHYLDKLGVRGIGVGHTHLQFVSEEGGRVVFNPGSVGQPRDGDWRAAYAILTVDGGSVKVEAHRAEYDLQRAMSKIRAAGLPAANAERLATGS